MRNRRVALAAALLAGMGDSDALRHAGMIPRGGASDVLEPESLGADEEVDTLPILEKHQSGKLQLPVKPLVVTLAPADDGSIVGEVLDYAGPKPPTDETVLGAFTAAQALLGDGQTDEDIYRCMRTIRGAATGVGKSGVLSFTGGDLPDQVDTCVLTITEPADELTDLVGETFGAVRKQAA